MTIDTDTTALVPAAPVALNGHHAGDDERPTLLMPGEERWVTETPTGLEFRADTPFEVWGQLAARLIRAHRRLEFALADAINFGGKRYGETYSQWVHDTGYSEKSLTNIAYVGRQVEISRRRENLSFGAHAEVAALPPKMQDSILTIAVEQKLTRDQVRVVAREAKVEIKRSERALKPLPPSLPRDVALHLADCRSLPLADGSVDLICTSPPYALEKGYAVGGDLQAPSWRRFIGELLAEAFRVAKPGGRLALNVPLDTTLGGFRPTYAQAVGAAQKAGWTYRTTVVWHDNQLGKSTARGSVDSAAAPHIIAPVETIVLMSKGPWGRETPWDRPSDLDHADWLEWTNGYWTFPGESNAWEEHPAPFPLELPRRLVYLLTFPGDVVLDPCMGSGTTIVAAHAAGRHAVGCDIAQEYLDATRRRLGRGG